MGRLQADIVARAASREEFATLAGGWLTATREELLPEFDRGLKAGPSLAFDHRTDRYASMGPAGGAAGDLHVITKPTTLGGSTARYSDRAWEQLLGRLGRTYPFHISLTASALDGRSQYASPQSSLLIGVHRLHEHPEWVTLHVQHALGGAGEAEARLPYPHEAQPRWAEFTRNWAARADACYAHVTDDATNSGRTALERATARTPDPSGRPRTPETTIPRCHEVLRGYSWVTVCAPELAARLGGAGALSASGAFVEVAELPGGQVFLRATRFIEDYQGDAVRRVFETLAPVLLAGRSRRPSRGGRLVEDVDAADYQ
jgi:hypothetical protein